MTSPLWTSEDAARATGGKSTASWEAWGVSIDTRTLVPGDLFVALQAVRDGHDFVAQALEQGAAAALVSRVPEGVSPDAPLLIVPDVLAGLEALGIAARARTSARVVGVTGSVGKTSTKEMLSVILAAQGKTHAAEASYNNHWGVPLTLARMPADCAFAVIEIGMNHPGEISPLARIAQPHVVMVTTVAAAHLEAFSDISGIAREKATIIDGLVPGGVAVLNADIPTADILTDYAALKNARPVMFGANSVDWQLRDVRLTEHATVLSLCHGDSEYLAKLSVPGRHFAMNAVGALAVAEALGADAAQACHDLAGWLPPAGRGTREALVLDAVRGETLDLIDDAFNANPTSMASALEVLAAARPVDDVGRIVKGRRIAILGDMLELGPEENAMHSALATNPDLLAADIVHCVGLRMKHLHEALPDEIQGIWAETAAELATHPARLVDAGDVVLVKGSKGSKVSLVVDAIRKLGHR